MKIRKPFESYDFEDEEAYLEHYGVKGMKWGKRKGKLSAAEYMRATADAYAEARQKALRNANAFERASKEDDLQDAYLKTGQRRMAAKAAEIAAENKAKAAENKAKAAEYAAKFQGAEQAMHAAKAAEASEKRKKEKRKQAIKSFFGKPGSLFKVNFKK